MSITYHGDDEGLEKLAAAHINEASFMIVEEYGLEEMRDFLWDGDLKSKLINLTIDWFDRCIALSGTMIRKACEYDESIVSRRQVVEYFLEMDFFDVYGMLDEHPDWPFWAPRLLRLLIEASFEDGMIPYFPNYSLLFVFLDYLYGIRLNLDYAGLL